MAQEFVTRREFNQSWFLSLLAAIALPLESQNSRATATSTRRVVIKQLLPGNPEGQNTLVEVVYPPGMGSPPHVHANGVMHLLFPAPLHRRLETSPNTFFILARRGGNRKERSTASRGMRARRNTHTYSRFILPRRVPVKRT